MSCWDYIFNTWILYDEEIAKNNLSIVFVPIKDRKKEINNK